MITNKPHILIMNGRWVAIGKMKMPQSVLKFVKYLNVSQGRCL